MEYFGAIRQQLWAFLHFPFHLALVLLMEGINQFVIWRHVVEQLDAVFGPLNNVVNDLAATPQQVFDVLNQTVSDTFSIFQLPRNENAIMAEISQSLDLFNPALNTNVTEEKLTEAADTIILELFKVIVEDYGFGAPGDLTGMSFVDQINAYFGVFQLIFGKFSLYYIFFSG